MWPEEKLTLVFLSGMATIYWTMVVAEAWLLRRRLPRIPCGLAMASAAVALIGLVPAAPAGAPEYAAPGYTAPMYGPPMYSSTQYVAQEQARVDRMRLEFTPALEAYREAHGRYPDTLEDAGIQTPQTFYGPLHYYGSRGERPSWYLLSFGDSRTGGFVADWDSRKQAWVVVEFDH